MKIKRTEAAIMAPTGITRYGGAALRMCVAVIMAPSGRMRHRGTVHVQRRMCVDIRRKRSENELPMDCVRENEI